MSAKRRVSFCQRALAARCSALVSQLASARHSRSRDSTGVRATAGPAIAGADARADGGADRGAVSVAWAGLSGSGACRSGAGRCGKNVCAGAVIDCSPMARRCRSAHRAHPRSLAGDRSFVDFASALALVRSQRLPDSDRVVLEAGWLDVLLVYPLQQPAQRFAMRGAFERLGVETHTVLHFVPPCVAGTRVHLRGRSGRIELDPGFWSATRSSWRWASEHILEGIDHLLFLFCLVVCAAQRARA